MSRASGKKAIHKSSVDFVVGGVGYKCAIDWQNEDFRHRQSELNAMKKYGGTTYMSFNYRPNAEIENEVNFTEFLVRKFYVYYPDMDLDGTGSLVWFSGGVVVFDAVKNYLDFQHYEAIRHVVDSPDCHLSTEMSLEGRVAWLREINYWYDRLDYFKELICKNWPVGVAGSLYRFFNSEDELLYVGASGNAIVRSFQHARVKPWWKEVTSSTIEHFVTRDLADQAEIEAIKTENPRYNIKFNRGNGEVGV